MPKWLRTDVLLEWTDGGELQPTALIYVGLEDGAQRINEFDGGFTLDPDFFRGVKWTEEVVAHPQRPGKQFSLGTSRFYWNQAGLDELGRPNNPIGYRPVTVYAEI